MTQEGDSQLEKNLAKALNAFDSFCKEQREQSASIEKQLESLCKEQREQSASIEKQRASIEKLSGEIGEIKVDSGDIKETLKSLAQKVASLEDKVRDFETDKWFARTIGRADYRPEVQGREQIGGPWSNEWKRPSPYRR